jgi:deferrochelatase/peroxidase EfeB
MLGVGAALDRAITGSPQPSEEARAAPAVVPFHGRRQAGIATPPQSHLSFASFDLAAGSPRALRELLVRWTDAATALTAGREYAPGPQGQLNVPSDTGEAVGLPPARLTLTFGFGPSLFAGTGRDRFGLAKLKPPPLEPLPPFPGDQLDPRRSGGDLCIQACADDPQVTFHAIHLLTRIGAPDATLRWGQTGFRYPSSSSPSAPTPRNLLGFKDGTDNIQPADQAAMREFVWVGPSDHPAWMEGGTYLVARRIELVLSTWDRLTLAQQERTIGRHKRSGAPLGGRREHDPVDFGATDPRGNPLIPRNAHIRLAAAAANGGQRILRRGYSYSSGNALDLQGDGGRQLDGGLFFIAFVRDPVRQFVPIQRRLASADALSAFTVHTASAVFACPPGIAEGGFIGQGLVA